MNFFLKLNPSRASFMTDMTEVERQIMQDYVAYRKPYVEDETVIGLGPVMDPKGGYGIAVVEVDKEERRASEETDCCRSGKWIESLRVPSE